MTGKALMPTIDTNIIIREKEGITLLINLSQFLKRHFHHWIWPLIMLVIMFFQVFWVNTIEFHIFGLGIMTTNLGIILFLISFSFLFRGRTKIIYLTIINLLVLLILLFDSLYFRYYNRIPSIYVFQQRDNVQGLGPSILGAIQTQDIILILPTIIFLIVGLWIYRLQAKRYFMFTIGLVILSLLITSLQPVKIYAQGISLTKRSTSLTFLSYYGILGAHILDSSLAVTSNKGMKLNASQKEFVEKQLTHHYPVTKYKSLEGIAKGFNVIMIQTESLQNFVINKSINGQPITPNLNKLLNNSFYFNHFYAQTAEGNSSDAELLTNTSLYPVASGSTYFRFPNDDYFSLGKMLKKDGYQVAAFHGDEADFWNRAQIYPHLGFNDFHSIETFKQNDLIGMGLSDKSFFRQSLPIIEKQKQPFYNFMITLSSHTPFKIPKKDQSLQLTGGLENTVLGDYIQSIHYTDEAIGEFLDTLKEHKMLDHTLVVIYGDHKGIFQRDQGAVEKYIAKRKISNEEWIREFTNVPLIIYNPNFKPTIIQKNAGEIDVLPTLAFLLGIPENQYQSHVLGNNIFSDSPDQVLLLNGDYGEEALIRGDQVILNVPEEDKKVLEASSLIIKSNYHQVTGANK
jgi:uncharacterized sulfatase